MTRKLALALVLSAAACGSSKTEQKKEPATCRIGVEPTTGRWAVSGNTLTLTDAKGASSNLRRSGGGNGARPIFGVWTGAAANGPGVSVTPKFQFDPSSITISADCAHIDGRSATARATSAATYTDTSFSILEKKDQLITFSDDLEEETNF